MTKMTKMITTYSTTAAEVLLHPKQGVCISLRTQWSLPSACCPPSPWPSPPRWSSGPLCTSGRSTASWSLWRWLPASRWRWRTGGIPNPPGDHEGTRCRSMGGFRLRQLRSSVLHSCVICKAWTQRVTHETAGRVVRKQWIKSIWLKEIKK